MVRGNRYGNTLGLARIPGIPCSRCKILYSSFLAADACCRPAEDEERDHGCSCDTVVRIPTVGGGQYWKCSVCHREFELKAQRP